MAHASQPLPSTLYRPKKMPRVLKRQLPVVWLISVLALGGVLAISITWKNLLHERLLLDVGQQQLQIETLRKEIQHIEGQIDNESSFARVSKWAREKRGWKTMPDHTGTIRLSESELTPAARDEARILSKSTHE
jgi:cell division protein FtsB